MKYMTQKNILIALGVLVAIALVVWGVQNSPAAKQQTTTEEQTATTTQSEEAMVTTTETAQVETTVREEGAVATETKTNTTSSQSAAETTTSQQPEQEKIVLGPRQPATVSPLSALQYFAEAMAAGDKERALTYFAESVRDQYRIVLFEDYKDREYPIVRAYFTGEVGPVELIQPEYGIYEVRVSPIGTKLAYTVNFFFENGEFRIWEL